jgi:hypothetical protein
MMSKVERETMERLKVELNDSRAQLCAVRGATNTEIENLKKQLESQKSTCEMYRNSSNKAEQELDSAHALLDGLPQAPARETEGKESYNRKEVALTTRLASWIAKVAFSEAFSKMGIK